MPSNLETIPAKHGTATFVPRGHTIKIVNTYGRQIIETWAFALHQPPEEDPKQDENPTEEQAERPSELDTNQTVEQEAEQGAEKTGQNAEQKTEPAKSAKGQT